MIAFTVLAIPSTVAALVTGFALSRRFRASTIAIAALFVAVLFASVPDVPLDALAWSALMATLLAALASFDAETLTVPDVLTLPLIVTGMAHAAVNIADPAVFLAAPAALIAAGWLAGKLAGESSFAWIGGGDILLVAGALAWLGPFVFFDYLLLTAVLVLSLTIVELLLKGGQSLRVALAPASAIAQIAIWFGGPIL